MSKRLFLHLPVLLLFAISVSLHQNCTVTPPQKPPTPGTPKADSVIVKPDTVILPIDTVVIVTDTITTEPDVAKSITICSFNIQFLGHFKKRDNAALANLVSPYDIVVVQELVAAPVNGIYPNGTSYTADKEAEDFLNAMKAKGFSYLLSEEDTGPVAEIHTSATSTEWWITFYKDSAVDVATDLTHGFLAADRSDNPDFERVPYAFPFRMDGTNTDFVLISVHLAPDKAAAPKRKTELAAIDRWIDAHDETETDYIILGDMNIEDAEELADALPQGFISLNNECYRTNTLINATPGKGAKPYDHIMYRPAFTAQEINEDFDIRVIDLVESMRSSWTGTLPYPGDPYNHNEFKQYYSDHHPVLFRIEE